MPPARRRMMPARSMSLWLTISASAGASLRVERKNCETRIRILRIPVSVASIFYSKIEAPTAWRQAAFIAP
jgi:hypothetical protein